MRVLTAAPVARLFRPLVRDAVPIFMFHRFADPELGSHGLEPRVLRAQLAYLRKNKFDLMPVVDLRCDAHGPSSRPAVAFTVDDGYADFASVAAPVFAEFDCPVTVFVVTSTMDDKAWLWWDRVAYAFAATARSSVELEIGGKSTTYRWADVQTRAVAETEFTEKLKTVSDAAKLEILARLGEMLDVEIPSTPPKGFATMSWEELRKFPAGGLVSFGPHTITHPILPQASDAQSAHEILGSWQRLRTECPAATPVFCYPNGAYSGREVTTFLESELVGALTSEFRYASRCAFSSSDKRRRFAVPRVASHDDHRHFVQIVNGIERVKLGVRRGESGWTTAGSPR